MLGCPLTAAVYSCMVEQGSWLQPHLAVRPYFDWTCRIAKPIQRTALWPDAWLSAFYKSRGSNSVEVQRVWEVYGDWLQFMAAPDALRLDDAFRREGVSDGWMVWSGAAETALADAFCFAGGPVPDRGLVLGRGAAQFRVVRLGGPKVSKARNNVADPLDGGDVFMYRDSSIAPSLDLRRRFKAVFGSFGWCDGCISRIGPICFVTRTDFQSVIGRGYAVGGWRASLQGQ